MDESLNLQQIKFLERLIARRDQLLDLKDAIDRDLTLYDVLDFSAAMTDAALKSSGFDCAQSTVWNAINAQRSYAASLDSPPAADVDKGVQKSDEAARVSLIKLMR